MELRPFVSWDGEGCRGENNIHPYSLLGASTGDRIKYYDLKTIDCLSLIMDVEQANRDAIHCGFAFGYDVNNIIKDLPEPQLAMLKIRGRTYWNGFSLEWLPRKWFSVSYGKTHSKNKTHCKIFDVFAFFNSKFGQALRKYEIGTPEELDRIEAMKEERPDFTWENIDEIERYWELELKYLVELMDKLRDRLYGAGYFITSWHGAGALASYALTQHDTRLHMDRGLSDDIIDASRFAYAGGRFQPFLAGYYEGPVYTADINSAYGYTFSRLPSLQGGKWLHYDYAERGRIGDNRLGLYKIHYKDRYSSRPHPLFHRDSDGSISFPSATRGWYHAPDAYSVANDPKAEFVESWIFEDDGSYPFKWIEEAYEERLEMQAKGDPTQEGHKRMIASLYGQVAQRAGWERKGEPPKWHQLEFAGAITAECRSLIYAAARSCGKGLVSIDTDGVMSLSPIRYLPGGIGSRLGQWKVDEYTGVLYVQSGIYWLRDKQGNWLPPKSRGIPRKKLAIEAVLPALQRNEGLEFNQHMFIGLGLAMRGQMHNWRKWIDEPRSVAFGGSGKTCHVPNACPACKKGLGYGEAMHRLLPVPPREIDSTRHRLPWLEREAIEESETELLRKWGVYSA